MTLVLSKNKDLKRFINGSQKALQETQLCTVISDPGNVGGKIHFHIYQLLSCDFDKKFMELRRILHSYYCRRELSKYPEAMVYFGFYEYIKLKKKITKLESIRISALAALERYDRILHVIENPKIDKKEFYSREHFLQITSALVQMVKKQKQSLNKKVKQAVFITFIRLYFMMHTAVELRTRKCGFYHHKYDTCLICIEMELENKIGVGYLMLFCAEIIVETIKLIKPSDLDKMSRKLCGRRCFELYQLKLLNADQMKEIGLQYVVDSGSELIQIQNDIEANGRMENLGQVWHILGDAYSLIKGNYVCANVYYAISITASQALYQRVLSMIALSDNCYKNGQYLIGYKLLKIAYKLSDGYMFPSFVNESYAIKRRRFRQRYKRMRCRYCHDAISSFKCCSMCMEMIYCSRRCQKIDWNQNHRNECGKTWITIYYLLREHIFKRL